jgi:predicted SAM-dependent methyltransferase
MGLFDNQKVGVAICTPHRKLILDNGEEIVDTITVQWHRARGSLALGTNINNVEFFCDGLEVGVARTRAARRCLEHKPRPLYLLFIDDDVLVNPDSFTKLFFHAQTRPDYDVFAGVYCTKGGNPPEPLIYQGNGGGAFWDWTVGDILTTEGHGITGIHMGITLIRVSLFQRLLDAGVCTDNEEDEKPFFKTVSGVWRTPEGCIQSRRGTEDLFFCHHLLDPKINGKILVDTSVLCGHIDKNTGITWGIPDNSPPVLRAKWLKKDDHKEACAEGKKIALDLGFGGHRRDEQFPGYRMYNLDIRPEVKPDYCQDTLQLNLPDNHFDMISSSHHLEHLGRWDQERAWSEIYRICKPGGRIDHVVPSLEWAAAKIADGQMDAHVLNVLYGSQESHGYDRRLNLHYFGYTKEIARALAEQAGFVEVDVQDWRDNENRAYEMTITGRKPGGEEVSQNPPPQDPPPQETPGTTEAESIAA